MSIHLKTTQSIILPELAKLQDKRLLSNRPVEYIDNFELKAAELIQKVRYSLETLSIISFQGLHSAIKKVEPAAVASVESIRKAIGVKY